MRLLMMADLSGHRNRTASGGEHATRRPMRIDIDSFDTVFSRIAPTFRPDVPPGATPVAFAFGSLDDFHPDRLLPGLRAGFPAPVPAVPAPATSPPADDTADTMERLLGRRPSTQPPASGVDAFIRTVVAPHITPAAPAAADSNHDTETAALRAVLHHPAFQRLEAAWRGVHWLANRLPLDDGRLELHVLDLSRADIEEDLLAAGESLEHARLYRTLVTDTPWSVIVSDLAFGPTDADVSLLAALGAIAAHAGGPLLAAARPEIAGLAAFRDAPDARDWPSLGAPQRRVWDALRGSALAPWIGLAAPRMLLRQPYGHRSDPIDTIDFDELGESREHEHYLWGSGALAVVSLMAESFDEAGWAFSPGDRLDVEDLPVHTYHEEGESRLQACAEAFLGERGYEALLAAGVMPLMSARHRGAVRLLRMQSIASPAAAMAGPWRS